MSKLNNFIRNNLLGAIIGGLVFGASGVIADTIVNSGDVSYKETDVKSAVDDLYNLQKNRIWETVYPVGSIYTSVNSTSPEELFGGTWESFGQGRTLVGMGSNGTTNYDTVEKTGGSETKTIAVDNLPAHTHSVNAVNTGNQSANHTHSVAAFNTGNQSANHTHTFSGTTSSAGAHAHTVPGRAAAAGGGGWVVLDGSVGGAVWTSTGGEHTHTYSGTTAGISANHNHQVPAHNTGNNSANHSHQVPAHNTNSTGSGTALNTQDPYITVYMWKRTA